MLGDEVHQYLISHVVNATEDDDVVNWVAMKIANFALNYIATPDYRDLAHSSLLYGIKAAIRDADRHDKGTAEYLEDCPCACTGESSPPQ